MADPVPTPEHPSLKHERALAGIFCRSGMPHPPQPLGLRPCHGCQELAEVAVVALWSAGVTEGRQQAAAAIRDKAHAEATSWGALSPPGAGFVAGLDAAARIAEGDQP